MRGLLSGLFLLSAALQAEHLNALLLDVLQTNPSVIERLKNFEATRADVTIARAGYYPTVDLAAGVGKERTDRTPTGGVMATTDFDVTQASLTYNQNLFNGFATLHRVDEQDARSVAAAYSYIESVNGTSLDLVTAYLEVMRSSALLETSRQSVKINQEIFNKVSKLYESGLTTLSEVNKIESSLALAKSNAVVNENNLASTRFALERLVGKAIDPAELEKPAFTASLPANFESAIDNAFNNNPSLLVSDYNIKQAAAVRNGAKSVYYPKVDLELSRSYGKRLSAYDGEEEQFKAMATVSFNLFNGFADKATLQKNAALLQLEHASRDKLRRQVKEGLNLAWTGYKKLQEQLKHLEAYKEFSLKTLTLYSKEYDLGRRSLLDLLAAQSDFIGSKSQIINTEYDILLAQYRILDTMGTMTASLLSQSGELYANVGLSAPTAP